jgi:hypothetical protein
MKVVWGWEVLAVERRTSLLEVHVKVGLMVT